MFNERLKSLRLARGYTQDQLVELYNKRFGGKLNKSTISRYENGLQEPMISVVANLAELFGVSIDYLNDTEQESDEDAELWDLRQQLREQPGMRTLFSAAKGVSKEDLEAAANMIRRFKREAEGEE